LTTGHAERLGQVRHLQKPGETEVLVDHYQVRGALLHHPFERWDVLVDLAGADARLERVVTWRRPA
jgi:hypothetical protein